MYRHHHNHHNHHHNDKQRKEYTANNVTVEKTEERHLYELNEEEFKDVVAGRMYRYAVELRQEMDEAWKRYIGDPKEEKDTETAYQESIERARELGVDEEHILDTHEKIDAFFRNN